MNSVRFAGRKECRRTCEPRVEHLKIILLSRGCQPILLPGFEFMENWTHVLIFSNHDENPGDLPLFDSENVFLRVLDACSIVTRFFEILSMKS